MQFIKNIKKKLPYISIIAALILVYLYTNKTYGIGLVCAFNVLTGFYCPGCGMTRAMISLLKLDFYQALRYNVFSIPIVIFITACFITSYFKKTIPKSIIYFFLILLILYGILRNIPIFSFLAPVRL